MAADVQPSEEEIADSPTRQGFLPIHTNLFDRFFISVVVFVAIHLLWLRFLEAGLSLYWGTALSVAVGVLIVARG